MQPTWQHRKTLKTEQMLTTQNALRTTYNNDTLTITQNALATAQQLPSNWNEALQKKKKKIH